MRPLSPSFLSAVVFGLAVSAGVQAADTRLIKKCQDATGKWHYGDTAAEECAKSGVTEISQQGVKKKESAAPLTETELAEYERRKEETERERQQAAEQKRKDELLLATYAHEDDITYARDRKLAQIESMIKASEDTLKSLRAVLTRMERQAVEESRDGKPVSQDAARGVEQTKAQIANHEAAMKAKREEQEAVRKQYAAELEHYREIRKSKVKPGAPAKQ